MSALDAQGMHCFFQEQNMEFIRNLDPAILMVAEKGLHGAIELLTSLKLKSVRIVFGATKE
jgi:hypothetical protein